MPLVEIVRLWISSPLGIRTHPQLTWLATLADLLARGNRKESVLGKVILRRGAVFICMWIHVDIAPHCTVGVHASCLTSELYSRRLSTAVRWSSIHKPSGSRSNRLHDQSTCVNDIEL